MLSRVFRQAIDWCSLFHRILTTRSGMKCETPRRPLRVVKTESDDVHFKLWSVVTSAKRFIDAIAG